MPQERNFKLNSHPQNNNSFYKSVKLNSREKFQKLYSRSAKILVFYLFSKYFIVLNIIYKEKFEMK